MLKRADFMAVIDGEFWVDARVTYKRETLSLSCHAWVESDYGHL